MSLKKPTFTLINQGIPFIFVVPPVDLRIEHGQDKEVVNIIDFGEKVFMGERQAIKISFGSFFPHTKSHFYSSLNPLNPVGCMEQLKKWKDNKAVLKFIIPEWTYYIKCRIDAITETRKDHTGDIYYDISLIEEPSNSGIIDALTGLFGRTT
jgi:hypothetical protein